MNIDAAGPDEIRAAFAAAIDTAGEHQDEVAGIASVLTEAADRFESLHMAASTLGHLRGAGGAFVAATSSLSTAREKLEAARSDFDARDGAVGDAVADAGNLAGTDILASEGGGGAVVTAAAAAPLAPVQVDAMPGPGGLYLGEGDGPYLDWSTRRPNGGRLFEAGDGQDALNIDLTGEQMRDLCDRLGRTLDATTGPNEADTGLYLGEGDGPYLDWSSRRPHGGCLFEVGDGQDALNIDLTGEQMRDLCDRLGRTLDATTGPNEADTGLYLGEGDGPYLDWSSRRPHGGCLFEVGDGQDAAVLVELTGAQLRALHAQLATDIAGDGQPTEQQEVDGEVDDVLGVDDGETCFGSDQVPGTGSVPTNLLLMDYGAGPVGDSNYSWDGGQYVEVVTPSGVPGDTYAAPALSPDESEQAAAHLDELAALAESGYRPAKPTRYGKAAQHLAHLVDRDQAVLDDRVVIGAEDQIPLTVRELLALLHAQDPPAATTRRKVTAQAVADAGGDVGVLWMDLDTGDDGTVRIAVTGIEGDSDTPDDDFWAPYTAHHTPASARELATKLRRFAGAARARPASRQEEEVFDPVPADEPAPPPAARTETLVHAIGRCVVKGCKHRRRNTLPGRVETDRTGTRTRWFIPTERGNMSPWSMWDGKEPLVEVLVRRYAPEDASVLPWIQGMRDLGWICPDHERVMRVVAVKGVINIDKTCDGRCMSATGGDCECACGGENHGASWG